MIAAASLAVVALLIGLGVRPIATFRLPYSFDALESATMVEIVDAPIIEMPGSGALTGQSDGRTQCGKIGNGNQENDSVQGNCCKLTERYRIG